MAARGPRDFGPRNAGNHEHKVRPRLIQLLTSGREEPQLFAKEPLNEVKLNYLRTVTDEENRRLLKSKQLVSGGEVVDQASRVPDLK